MNRYVLVNYDLYYPSGFEGDVVSEVTGDDMEQVKIEALSYLRSGWEIEPNHDKIESSSLSEAYIFDLKEWKIVYNFKDRSA